MATIFSASCEGITTILTRLEGTFLKGFADMKIIGNTSEVCRDGKERAKAALETLGYHIPPRRLIISLTPGELKKDGSQFDLPLSVLLAILIRQDSSHRSDLSQYLFAGELGLDGEIRPVKGIIALSLTAISSGLKGVIISQENLEEVLALKESSLLKNKNLAILGFKNLKDVLVWCFNDAKNIDPPIHQPSEPIKNKNLNSLTPNYDDMILNEDLYLSALTVAVGHHSLILRGAPGTGKSMFAQLLPSIFPPMSSKDHIEAMKIYSSYLEKLPQFLIEGRPPYRAPHHQASANSILGGSEQPGELSLAHGGVLFLDEVTEFRRDLLESLREPLETKEVRVARAKKKLIWSANITLIAACNNCPCGWFGSSKKECTCPTPKLLAYRQRLSGPLLDRIDMHINVSEPRQNAGEIFIALSDREIISRTDDMRKKVSQSLEYSISRNQKLGVNYNSELSAEQLVQVSGHHVKDFSKLIDRVIPSTASNRSMLRCLRVARTLADLDPSEKMLDSHLEKAWSWQAEPAAIARGESFLYS